MRVVVARLLESTNAADQSILHLVTCSHHVIFGFRGPEVTLNLLPSKLYKNRTQAQRRDRRTCP